MQLSEFIAGVYDRLGVDSSDPAYPAATIARHVNAALRQTATKHDWPWLETEETITTVNGTGTYTPYTGGVTAWTGTKAVSYLTGTTLVPLGERTRDELDDQYGTDTGAPEAYSVFGEQLLIRPVPAAAYTLHHRLTFAEKTLTNSTDSPYLPPAYDDPVCDLAAFLALGSNNQDQRAAAALARYTAWLADMADNRRRSRRPGRIRVRPGGWL